MKVGVGQAPIFAKISTLEKDVEPKREKQEEAKQNHLQNTAFVELKKANQQIAKLQSRGISFGEIQKELGELQGLKSEEYDSQEKLNKIKALQDKLNLLLKNTKEYEHFTISPKNLNDADQKLKNIQNKIQEDLKEEQEKIEKFFANTAEYRLDEKMLKDDRFREAHDVKRLSSSFADLIA